MVLSPKLPLSVFIIAKNEADRIDKSITSTVHWADEVIVIDSGSTDNTVALSESLGARVIYHAWQGYGVQKIYGESLCRNKWIINIDADEEISPALAAEIQALFANGKEPSQKAFHLKIAIVHRFDTSVSSLAPYNAPIRLYHRDFASFDSAINGTYHDSVLLKDSTPPALVGQLNGRILHRSVKSIAHAMEKANFCTTMQAKEMFEKGRCPSRLRLFCEPFTAFLKAYILRRYFIYGYNGVVDSLLFAFTRFTRLAKAREYFQEQAFRQAHSSDK